jgi:hypothetical protein
MAHAHDGTQGNLRGRREFRPQHPGDVAAERDVREPRKRSSITTSRLVRGSSMVRRSLGGAGPAEASAGRRRARVLDRAPDRVHRRARDTWVPREAMRAVRFSPDEVRDVERLADDLRATAAARRARERVDMDGDG